MRRQRSTCAAIPLGARCDRSAVMRPFPTNMMRILKRTVVCAVLATTMLSAAACVRVQIGHSADAAATAPAADWPSYNRTLAGDRYSPLTQIDRSNVTSLRTVCAYALPEVTDLQTGPIVVNGTM